MAEEKEVGRTGLALGPWLKGIMRDATDIENIGDDFLIEDLELDSLDTLFVIGHIEQTLYIELPDTIEAKTVGEWTHLLGTLRNR